MNLPLAVAADLRVRRGRGELRLIGSDRTLWVEPVGWRGAALAIRSAWMFRRSLPALRRAASVARLSLRIRIAGFSLPLVRSPR